MSIFDNDLQKHLDFLNNEIFAINEIFDHKISQINPTENDIDSLKLEM
jgi:hypothetical protein